MCGRFFLDADFEDMVRHLNISINRSEARDYEPRTIFPSQESLVLIKAKSQLRLGKMKWGFMSSALPKPLINSRAETILEKNSFRESVLKRRCIIPASGYFEWSGEGKNKRPFIIHAEQSPLLYMAGIYSSFETPDGLKAWSYGIVTREANEQLREIHPRMPLIFPESMAMDWLSEDMPLHRLKGLLAYTETGLAFTAQNTAT